jgi:hypothetical protein
MNTIISALKDYVKQDNFDMKVLFDPFKERFHLQAAPVNSRAMAIAGNVKK